MSRIKETFARLKAEGRKALIPFIMAGDPDLEATCELIVELSRSGADVIEVGAPFSDPVADGPVIQRAAARALRNRVSLSQVLDAISTARGRTDAPIVLFSYFNPLMRFGAERLSAEAKRAGVDAILTTDMTHEEDDGFSETLMKREIDCIRLAAPTSTDERLRLIAERASGFVYAVSRAGVTGERADVSADAERLVDRLRKVTELPIVVGFGISDAKQVAEVWRYADGAVVGSALVAEIERGAAGPEVIRRAGLFMRNLIPKVSDED